MNDQITPEALIERGFNLYYAGHKVDIFDKEAGDNVIRIELSDGSAHHVYIQDASDGIELPPIKSLAQLDRIIAVVRGDE